VPHGGITRRISQLFSLPRCLRPVNKFPRVAIPDSGVSCQNMAAAEGVVRLATVRNKKMAGQRDGERPRRPAETAPASRVARAATTNDKMDADIQLAGVKWIWREIQAQADTHQDT
jgi:hypothetical protein